MCLLLQELLLSSKIKIWKYRLQAFLVNPSLHGLRTNELKQWVMLKVHRIQYVESIPADCPDKSKNRALQSSNGHCKIATLQV